MCLFVTVSQVNSWFVKIVLKQIIAAIRPLRKFRMVFYNFCYYFSGKHWRWTEISILGNEFFGFHKFPLHPTLSLPPCPTAASVSLHWLHQGFPTFPFQCTPSFFQQISMCIPHQHLDRTCRPCFLSRFRDPVRVPRISNRVPRIRENYHRVPKIRENRVSRIRDIGSLQIHTGYLTFYLKKPWCRLPLKFPIANHFIVIIHRYI